IDVDNHIAGSAALNCGNANTVGVNIVIVRQIDITGAKVGATNAHFACGNPFVGGDDRVPGSNGQSRRADISAADTTMGDDAGKVIAANDHKGAIGNFSNAASIDPNIGDACGNDLDYTSLSREDRAISGDFCKTTLARCGGNNSSA